MRHIGIDYGQARVGVAVSDEGGSIAFPRDTLPNDNRLIPALAALVAQTGAENVVVGDTRALSGAENAVTREADAFAAKLGEAIAPVPVVRGWEAWSSVEAARFAPHAKSHDDAAAAAIILQRFLDTQNGRAARGQDV